MALLRSSSTITSAPGEQRDNRILRPSTSAMISTSISSAGRPLKIGTIRLNEAGTIGSVHEFLLKRISEKEQINQKRCYILVDREKMTLKLVTN